MLTCLTNFAPEKVSNFKAINGQAPSTLFLSFIATCLWPHSSEFVSICMPHGGQLPDVNFSGNVYTCHVTIGSSPQAKTFSVTTLFYGLFNFGFWTHFLFLFSVFHLIGGSNGLMELTYCNWWMNVLFH